MSRVVIGDVSVSTTCECTAKYQWTVYNFWISCKDGCSLVSPQFLASHDSNPVILAQFRLYPKSTNLVPCSDDYFSLFAKVTTTSAEIVEVSLSILNNGVELMTRRFNKPVVVNIPNLWGAHKFMNRNLITNNASKASYIDKLTIVLRINTRKSDRQMSVLQTRKKIGQLSGDYEKLVNNEEFSDVELKIGNKSLRAHKFILSKRSYAFANMFRIDTRGRPLIKVEISDVRYEVCLEMLRYIYAGRVNGLENIADELLAAAANYGVRSLKLLCEKSLCETLNLDNVVERLRIAHVYFADMLKVKTIGFTLMHRARIVDRPEFRELPPEVVFGVAHAQRNRRA